MKTLPLLAATLSLAGTFTLASSSFAQGDLNPPAGPPTPTMKALDQIEPRTLVNATNTPGDGTATFIISAPGSYYLTGNLRGEADKDGIHITSNDVTIDLNGFAVVGVAGSHSGIIADTVQNLAVRRGTVRDWGYSGVDVSLATNSIFEQIRASNNGTGGANYGSGISVGYGSIVTDCASAQNSASGIVCAGGAALRGCVAQGNNFYGFEDDFPGGSTFANCAARTNTSSGFASAAGSTFMGCTAKGNVNGYGISAGSDSLITGCSITENKSGIFCNNTCTISNNTVTANRGTGISTFGGCLILNNTASHNGTSTPSDGILTVQSNNRIEGNQTVSNTGKGINSSFSSTADYIFRNTSISNSGGNYNPSSGNYFGPLGFPGTSTSPWANF